MKPPSSADDLPFIPFEITVGVPADWPGDYYRQAVSTFLGRFLKRYWAFQAYGQHL
jgi:hypothetical protein